MSDKFLHDPLHEKKSQGGFEQDNIRSGNLRDHDGCYAVDKGFMSTKHYDGDTPPITKDSPRAKISGKLVKGEPSPSSKMRTDMVIGVRG